MPPGHAVQPGCSRNKDLDSAKTTGSNIPYNSNKYQVLRDELRKIPGVLNASGAAYIPPGNQWWITNLKNPDTGEEFEVEEINGDYDLVETLGIQLQEGRSFSRDFGSDSIAILINETGLRKMGIKDPLETILIRNENDPVRSRKMILVYSGFSSAL
jgi:hypothetical protein